MKKRLTAIALTLAVVLSLATTGALAASGRNYGNVPIYIGYSDVDYMAEEILKDIPTEGKSAKEQIRAVYDWIIKNCDRYTWDGTYYFDESAVDQAISSYFHSESLSKLDKGNILVRAEFEEAVAYDQNYEMYVMSYDSNDYIANFAYDMMMTRSGNCAHYSALLALLLGHLGFDCRLIAGEFINGNGSKVEHKWNYVLVDGQYYWLDVRMDHATYSSTGKINYKYFMIASTEDWSTRHSWDHTYSDDLAANAADIAEAYAAYAAERSGEPWSRCSDWARDAMARADQAGLIPESLSCADLTRNITRAEFAAVAVALYESLKGSKAPAYTGQSPFTDTSDADVLRAYGLGVVNGTGEGTFSPDSTLTREQAVTMLGRVYELVRTGSVGSGEGLAPGNIQSFADDKAISAYARSYLYFFVDKGIINGVGNDQFAPRQAMTREAALKVAVEAADWL